MSEVGFTLTYDGPALRNHEMNVRDLAPAMLAVGEVFEAMNTLYNGKAAQIAVNVRAHEPGCFRVVFDVVQAFKDATPFLAGQGMTGAANLLGVLFGVGAATGGAGHGLLWLIRKLRGKSPDRIERLSPGLFRLTVGQETFEVPVELLEAYRDLKVRRAVEGFVSKPLQKPGITLLQVENKNHVVETVRSEEAFIFRAPEPDYDVIVDDTRKAAYTIRDLSFDEDGSWRLFDGANPIKARITDSDFLARVEADEVRFAKHDVLVCLVHFVQRRAATGVTNEYTVEQVLEHIAAPRQLRLPEIEPGPGQPG